MATGRLIRKVVSIPMADGRLRLGAVADTHSRPHPALIAHLTNLRPHAILHGGDIGELTVLDQLGAVAPVFAVRGNIDSRVDSVPDVLLVDVVGGDRKLRILLIHIAVAGPRLRGDVARMARAEGASLVVCGHSHVPFMSRERDLAVFNPGSAGPRRFHLPILFGMIDVTPTGIELVHVDCETGARWHPPALSHPAETRTAT